jgi:hypothetical protein
VLHSAALMTAGLAVVALIAEGMIFFNAENVVAWRRYIPAVSLLFAVVIMVVLMAWIGPRIETLREQIGAFTPANENSPERQLFRKLHGASMGLSLLQTISVAIAFVVGLI